MLRTVITYALVYLVANSLYAQNLKWADTFDFDIEFMEVDKNGNVYAAGSFANTQDFDPGPGIYNLNSNGTDGFVLKLDPLGNFLWAQRIGGSDGEWASFLSVDSSGISMGLRISGVIDVDPGSSTLYKGNANEIGNVFLRFNHNGQFVHAEYFPKATLMDWERDNQGNHYLTGKINGTADVDPGSGVHHLSGNSGGSAFVVKLNSSYQFQWGKLFSSNASGSSIANSLIISLNSDVVVAGSVNYHIDLNPGSDSSIYSFNSFDPDMFIVQLDSSGQFKWGFGNGNAGDDRIVEVLSDPAGNIYYYAFFEHSVDFDPDSTSSQLLVGSKTDAVIVKLDQSGNFIWAAPLQGTKYEDPTDLKMDKEGNLYASGGYWGQLDLDPGAGVRMVQTPGPHLNFGSNDIYLVKLDSTGNFIWGFALGDSQKDHPNAIDIDTSGNIYIAGVYGLSPDYQPGIPVFNLPQPTSSLAGMVVKYDQCIIADKPNLLSSQPDYCPGDSIQIMVSSSDWLFSADYWFIRKDSCDAAILDSSSSGVFELHFDSTSTYFVNGGAGCAPANVCSQITINAHPTYNQSIQKSICKGDSFVFPDNTIWYNLLSDTSHVNHLTSVDGCDSTVVSHVSIYPMEKEDTLNICYGDTVSLPDSTVYTASSDTLFTYQDSSALYGCDSLYHLYIKTSVVDTGVTVLGTTSFRSNQDSATYQWLECNAGAYQTIAGETNRSFTATTNGSYAVRVTYEACTRISKCLKVEGIDVTALSFQEALSYYPNPASGRLSIKMPQCHSEIMVNISTITGELIETQKLYDTSHFNVKLGNTPGYYLIEITSSDRDERAVIKVVNLPGN